jgi:hypothetical protein
MADRAMHRPADAVIGMVLRSESMDRKEMVRQYKETPRPAGVYRVRNGVNGKSLVGSSPNLPGMLNRQRFQLEQGSHPHRELQADWNEYGAGAFTFEVLDQLKPSKEPLDDPSEDLRVLLEMWLEKLEASGEPLYARLRRGGEPTA